MTTKSIKMKSFRLIASLAVLLTASAAQAQFTVCPEDSVEITGSSINGSTIFNWYDALVGGNLLYTGNPFTTGPLSSDTTFYLATENSEGCESVRTPVLVLVAPNLDVPVGTVDNDTLCPGSSANITATSLLSYTEFNWYDALTGGNLLDTGSTFNTGTLSATTTFYLESVSPDGCKSVRTPVLVVVLPNLDVPVGTPDDATVCSGAVVTITAASINGSTVFNWYDAPTGGNLLFTGNPYVTDPISANTTFYLESESDLGCTSPRTAVAILTAPNTDVPVASPVKL